MAIKDVVTGGFIGTSVNDVPTRGFDHGAAIVDTVEGLEFTLRRATALTFSLERATELTFELRRGDY